MSRDKLISKVTNQELLNKWNQPGALVGYAGIDPTASGVHMGHLLWIHLAIDLLKNGHKFIVLIGGFTGQIGDPTDKTATRTKIDGDAVNDNSAGILSDLKSIFEPYKDGVIYVNNKEWLDKMTLGDYLNHYGYGISVNRKLKMDTFARRIDDKQNLTMSEFFYPDLQMIDFYYLNKYYGCNVQLGGHDQYGNIALGTHYVEHFSNSKVYAAVTPLLTDSQGGKLGKSAGAKFLRDFKSTYHFCMNISDSMANMICEFFDVKTHENHQDTKRELIKYIFSLLDRQNYESRYQEIFEYMNRLFYSSVDKALESDFITVKSDNVIKLLVQLNLIEDEFEAAKKIREKAIKLNGVAVDNIYVTPGTYKLSMGKKNHAFIKVIK